VLTSGGRNVSFSPYGATWRALRRNLASGVLNPARLPYYMQQESIAVKQASRPKSSKVGRPM